MLTLEEQDSLVKGEISRRKDKLKKEEQAIFLTNLVDLNLDELEKTSVRIQEQISMGK